MGNPFELRRRAKAARRRARVAMGRKAQSWRRRRRARKGPERKGLLPSGLSAMARAMGVDLG